MYQRALEGYEKALGLEIVAFYIPALNTAYNLGLLFAGQGNIDRARAMYLGALIGYEKVFGHDYQECGDLQNPHSSLAIPPINQLNAYRREKNSTILAARSSCSVQPRRNHSLFWKAYSHCNRSGPSLFVQMMGKATHKIMVAKVACLPYGLDEAHEYVNTVESVGRPAEQPTERVAGSNGLKISLCVHAACIYVVRKV